MKLEAGKVQMAKLLRELAEVVERSGNDGESLYFIQAGADGPIKIGRASNPDVRRNDLQSGNHVQLHILLDVPGSKAAESLAHAAFAGLRIRGEWFRPEPQLTGFIKKLESIFAEAA